MLQDKETVLQVDELLASNDAFDQTWVPEKKELVVKIPKIALATIMCSYWF